MGSVLTEKSTRLSFAFGIDHDAENIYDDGCDEHGDDDDETGVTDDEYVMRSIKAEAMLFGDIVQGSFNDTYR